MTFNLKELTKNIDEVDINDILSGWQWRLGDMKNVIMISCLGDLFIEGPDNAIYWLQTECGDLTKVAEDLQEFNRCLTDEEMIDNWFLPELVEKLIAAGKTLKKNEVYSFKMLPVIGGDYSVENIDPTDMSAHFSLTGYICDQIKDLPDGTKVNIKVIE